MNSIISTFKSKANNAEQALVLVFDLEGFSKFFGLPDVQDYVAKYLNIVLQSLNIIIEGGAAFWSLNNEGGEEMLTKLPSPIHSKFLGDGVLYVWNYSDFSNENKIHLVNRLYTFKRFFHRIIEKAADEINVMDIPTKIRFGMSAGSVFKLEYADSEEVEYIGYCINLASRLQNYCGEIGLIVSGRVNLTLLELEKHKYRKVVATDIKGFREEIVIIDEKDFQKLDVKIRESLFREI